MVTGLHGGDALTHGLDNTGTLMAKDDGESAFWVFAREGVRIFEVLAIRNRGVSSMSSGSMRWDIPVWQTPV